MAGGFTEIALLPNTSPSVETKNAISYLTRNNEDQLVTYYPLASVTRGNKGEELTEMIDLHRAGAVGFTDGLKPLWHTDIFLKALQYLQSFDGVLIDHPEDTWLNMFGQMHEGTNSTRLGLKGMPRIAEEIAVSRNIELLAYAGGRLHCARISTARTVDLIRAAKKRLKVSCDVAAYQPVLNDELLKEFDTNYKVNPPLRERVDNDALIKGLKDGTIDVICSGHTPQDEESKNVEFDLSEFVEPSPEEETEMVLKLMTQGLITPNEARQGLNYPPLPDGDEIRLPPGSLTPEQMKGGTSDAPNPGGTEEDVSSEPDD